MAESASDPYVNNRAFLSTLMDLGVPEQTARGALGSISWESGKTLNGKALAEGDGADGSDSISWGQWNQGRADNLRRIAAGMGTGTDDPRAITQHIREELTGPYKHVLDALKAKNDMYHGADVWTRSYEIPAVKNVDQRHGRAMELARAMGGSIDHMLPTAPTSLDFRPTYGPTAPVPAFPGQPKSGWEDLYTPLADSSQDQKMAQREATAGFWQSLGPAFSTSSLTGSILRAGSLSGFQPDATPYQMTEEELKRRTTGLAPNYASWFERAVSAEHADALERAARQHQDNLQTVQAAGWKGTAASILSMVLDPAGLAFGAATGGLGNMAAKAYQLGTVSRIGLNAGLGAAANVGLDQALHAAGDPEEHSVPMAIATGVAFGGLYGWLSKGHINPTKPIPRDKFGRPIDTTPPRDWTGPGPDARAPGTERVPEVPGGEGPHVEQPRPVPPSDAPTGVPEADAGIARTRETPSDTEVRKVDTQVVTLHPQVDDAARLVQEMAAKFGVTDLIRVGRVEDVNHPQYRLALGLLQKLSDGTYVLRVAQRMSPQARIEAVIHEFGHLLDHHFFGSNGFGELAGGTHSSPELLKAWKEFRAKADKQTIHEFFKEYLGPGLNEHFAVPKNGIGSKPAKALDNYAYRVSPEEWFAQEVGKWAVSNREPQNAIEKVFGKVVDYWRKLYSIATGKPPTSSEAVTKFLKGNYDAQAVPSTYTGPTAAAALEGPNAPTVSAVHVNPGRPQLASDTGLGGIGGQVPETALGNLRFSIAAQLGKSKNPAVRALGNVLVEDTVGKKDGAATGLSAELYATQRTRAGQTRLAQSHKVAYDKWRGENGLGYFEARRRVGEFEETISAAIRETDPLKFDQYPAWVKAHVANRQKIIKSVLDRANNPFHEEGLTDGRPVGGFGSVPGDENYLMRVFSAQKVADLVEKHGEAKLVSFIAGAIRAAQPGIEPRILDRLSAGYFREIYKRANGVIDEKVSRMFAVDNLEVLRDELQHRWGLNPQDAEDLVKKLRGTGEGGKDARARRRLLLDETFTDGELKMSDFFVNNATALDMAYIRHMEGKIALARTRIFDPDSGEMLVNGITNDGDFNALINHIRQRGHDERIPSATAEKEIEALREAYNQITGVPHELYDQDWAKAIRAVGKFNLMRLGHQFVFAQAGEVYNMIANLGVKTMMQQIPAMKRIVTADGQWLKAQGLDREIEGIFGIGADRIRLSADISLAGADDMRSLPMEAAGFWDRADRGLNKAGHMVLELSGFHLTDGLMKQWTAKAIAQKFADMARRAKEVNGAFDTSHVNYRRMAQLGLDDAMLQRVLRGVKDNFSTQKGMLFDHKVTRMNLDKWADQEARIAFEGALMRHARMIIQENDIGSAHRWMSHPLWRMIMQFRAFPLHAWDKQLMLNAAMHDTTSVTSAVLGAAVPAMIYSMQQQLAAIGRSDREEWLKKRTDAKHMMTAMIQRHGWSSMLPTIVDSMMPFVGQKGVFDARTTQQQADLFFGNPTASLVTDVSKATGNIVKSFTQNRKLSQDEIREVGRLFGNNLVTGAILNTLSQGRELHPPKSALR